MDETISLITYTADSIPQKLPEEAAHLRGDIAPIEDTCLSTHGIQNATALIKETIEMLENQLQRDFNTVDAYEIVLTGLKRDDDLPTFGYGTDRRTIVGINTKTDGFDAIKHHLKATFIHEYAHGWYFEKRQKAGHEGYGANNELWIEVLREAHAMLIEKVLTNMTTHWAEKFDLSREEKLPTRIKEILSDKIYEKDEFIYGNFFYGSDTWSDFAGYRIAYEIGEYIIKNRNESGIDAINSLVNDTNKQEVMNAVDAIYSQ